MGVSISELLQVYQDAVKFIASPYLVVQRLLNTRIQVDFQFEEMSRECRWSIRLRFSIC